MSSIEFIVKNIAEVGSFIKNQRKGMDVTQDELANFAGLSRVGVVKLEKEEGDIKLSTLLKVANLLGFEIVLKKRSNK
jgi:DNA-binding XRE family transcriptional regulator